MGLAERRLDTLVVDKVPVPVPVLVLALAHQSFGKALPEAGWGGGVECHTCV